MDRIVKKSEFCGGVKIGECTVQRLLFADDLVLLHSAQNGLQQALVRFSDACSVAGMKISSTKTETMCLSRQPKQCSLQIDGVPLKQSEKFKYLGVSFTSDGRQNSKMDIRIGKASAVMRQLHRSVVLKRELCTKAKLSIFRSVYVPILKHPIAASPTRKIATALVWTCDTNVPGKNSQKTALFNTIWLKA